MNAWLFAFARVSGNAGASADANTIRIGAGQSSTYIAGIYGATVAKGVGVVVDSTGKLGTKGSSERFKTEIKSMDKASEAVLAVKPVMFRYKKELDPDATPQFGLVAEDVANVNPDLVVRDDKGQIYTVRYDAVNAMLLNEFLKEHCNVQELQTRLAREEATRAKQDEQLAQQQKQIEALTAGLEKVNTRIELSERARQLAVNDRE